MLILTMIGITTNSYSQSTLLWSENFTTGLSDYYSEYPSIQVIADTIEVVGRKNTPNGQRLLIVKYDLLGDKISTKTFGNDSVLSNSIIDYKFDAANHLYILHNETLGYNKSKIVLQKYSLDGNLIWVEQIHNHADTSYTSVSLTLVNDTCLFVTAHKEYDYPETNDDIDMTTRLSYLYAFNSSGNLLWLREFDPNTMFSWSFLDLYVQSDTVIFFTRNPITLKISMIKIDINNNLTIIENTTIPHGVSKIYSTTDNNLLLVAGVNYTFTKISNEGVVIWTHEYGTNLPSNVSGDEIRATLQDSVGNILITGKHYGKNYGYPNYTNADILTIKYDSNGNLIWQNRYEYGGNNADIGNTIVLKNGQIYVGGQSQRLGQGTDYDYVVLKIDFATGISTGVYRYDGPASGNDAVSSLYVFDNGNIALTGLSYTNSQYDWTTQLLSDVVLSIQNISSQNNFRVYPNPAIAGQILNIKGEGIKSYSIISSTGKIVQQGKLEAYDFHSIQLENLMTGMYLLYLQTDKEIKISKIIVK